MLKLTDTMTGDVAATPDLQHASIPALADFYAEHILELEQLEWWLRVARKRLINHIRTTGDPLPTDHGLLHVGIDGHLGVQAK